MVLGVEDDLLQRRLLHLSILFLFILSCGVVLLFVPQAHVACPCLLRSDVPRFAQLDAQLRVAQVLRADEHFLRAIVLGKGEEET